MYGDVKTWPLFLFAASPSCLTAGGHMLLSGRGLTAVVLRVKTDPSPTLGQIQMLLKFLSAVLTVAAVDVQMTTYSVLMFVHALI